MAAIALSLFIVFLILLPMAYSVSESEALLQLKKSFTNSTPLVSWVHGSEPCPGENNWDGLVCYSGIVTGLRLGEMGLSGKIDIDALLQLHSLRTLSIVNNSFSGSIPDFNRLGALKAIYISGNEFSGEIPSNYFTKMESLKKVWLSDNKFSGEIPFSLTKLPHLIELHLENNQFSGAIPSMFPPTMMSLNLSNNKLEGEIPASLSKFNASSFAGNNGLCGEKLGKGCDQPGDVENSLSGDLENSLVVAVNNAEKENNKIAAAIMTSGAVLLSLVLVAIVLLRRRGDETFNMLGKENLDDQEVEVHVSGSSKKDVHEFSKKGPGSSRKGSSHGKAGGSIGDLVMVNDEKGVFGLQDLMKAAAEVLGNGGLGSSYKAMMSNGVTVVVKRMRDMNKMGKDGFDAEVRRLGRLRHWNILTPLAYHYRKDEMLLVYEFIPRGSLLYQLHGDRGPSHADLNWPTRLKIVQGISKGLSYLHSQLASSELPHGNLKSSNVLLSSKNEPLLSEYGFHPLTNTNQVSLTLFAYKAPEAAKHHQISPKCDVYCLGIIILEVLTGKFPSQYVNNGRGGTDVVQWALSAIAEGREIDLLDPEITNAGNSIGEMEKLLHIGAACTESNPNRRLDLREAVRLIEQIQTSGSQDARSIQLLPSLRDGYADSTLSSSQAHRATGSREDYGELSGKRRGSFEDGSGHRNGGSFAFPIS